MKKSSAFNKTIRIAFVSAFSGTVAVLFLIILFSLVSLVADFSDRICSAASHVSLFAGCFASGTVNAFFSRRKGWLHGAEGGAEVFIVFAAVCILSGADMSVHGSILCLIISLSAGVMGGISGVNIKMNDKKYRFINRFLYNA